MAKPFKGVINIDVRDSKPDWAPFIAPKAPKGAPNVLIVLYDDTGLAAWSPFGGRINMPTLQTLADSGLTYSQWHTTALCSPTRSCFLTGRNHHQNGVRVIAEGATGFPGSHGHIPMENALPGRGDARERLEHVLAGQEPQRRPSTSATWARPSATGRSRRGFDRFYGFLGGETEPVVSRRWSRTTTTSISRTLPEDGYHLSKDLADKAISVHPRQQAVGARQAVVHVVLPGRQPRAAPRAAGVHRQVQGQVRRRLRGVPRVGAAAHDREGHPARGHRAHADQPDAGRHVLARCDMVRPWDTLIADEKRLFSRMAEVYAGFSEYTDAQVGRIIDYLEESGQLDNTLIIYCADNGASGEGSPNGSVNENKFFNGYPDEIEENLAMLDELGSPETYNHYPTGWAMAFSTPFRMFKRYSYQGGVCDPLVIHWPKGIKAQGRGARPVPPRASTSSRRSSSAAGSSCPRPCNGYEQTPLPGVSMRYTFDDADAPTTKETQYYAMLGTRGIWHDGWKAVAVHGPIGGIGNFDKDAWELFHTDEDRSEAHDLAEQHPEKLKELVNLWFAEAGKYDVLPLDDRLPSRSSTSRARRRSPPAGRVHLLSGHDRGARVRARSNVRGRSFKILAEVELTDAGRARRDLRARLALRRPRAVHQGQEAVLRLQLPRHPARAEAGLERRSSPASTCSAWSSSARRPASTASRSARPSSTSTTRSWPKADADAARSLLAVRRRALRRARQLGRGQPRVRRRASSSPAARSSRSRSTSARSSTSTSRRKPRR